MIELNTIIYSEVHRRIEGYAKMRTLRDELTGLLPYRYTTRSEMRPIPDLKLIMLDIVFKIDHSLQSS